MITEKGKEEIATLIKTNFLRMNIGTGTDSTNPNSNTLDNPRTAVSSNNISAVLSNDNEIEFKASFNGSESALTGYTISEVGIFNSSDSMFNRVDFEGVGPLTSTDVLEFTILVQVE